MINLKITLGFLQLPGLVEEALGNIFGLIKCSFLVLENLCRCRMSIIPRLFALS